MDAITWRCPECDWRYDEACGDASEGFAPGTALAAFPEAWSCPDCGVRYKGEFELERAEARPPSPQVPAVRHEK